MYKETALAAELGGSVQERKYPLAWSVYHDFWAPLITAHRWQSKRTEIQDALQITITNQRNIVMLNIYETGRVTPGGQDCAMKTVLLSTIKEIHGE